MRRMRRVDRGQALVEFALAIPIFLLIVVALVDLGRGVFVYNALTNAAREAARLAIVNQHEDSIEQRAQDMAFGVTISTAAGDLADFHRQDPNADEPCITGSADDPMRVGCIAVITAEASWEPITPIIGNLIGPIDLEATSELPVELVCPNSSIPAYATPDLCPKQP
jgi:hypothetical protein